MRKLYSAPLQNAWLGAKFNATGSPQKRGIAQYRGISPAGVRSGDPVLAGVDLASGYLFGLSLRASCSGADWAEVLGDGQAQRLDLSVVLKDAGEN